jgi:diacylglycerol O-acyltransferase / trehalose O-mycolyltransferase
VAGCGGGGGGSTATDAGAPLPAARADDGARIVSVRRRSPREIDLGVRSPAVGRTVPVRLLLPARFASDPARRWPVVYLLHGCCDTYVSWTRSTDVEQLAAPDDVIVAMPDGGRAGFYSDWRRGPRWETFHLVELRQLLERAYRADDRRAIAGFSMGGLGALGYAARHPGMFAAAASYSGLLHPRADPAVMRSIVDGQGEDATALWGGPLRDAERWAAHDPSDLAGRLRGTRLFVSSGNGQPGPLDRAGAHPDAVERFVERETLGFVSRARRLKLSARLDLYGPGTHTYPYWQRELHRSWPLLMRAVATRPG